MRITKILWVIARGRDLLLAKLLHFRAGPVRLLVDVDGVLHRTCGMCTPRISRYVVLEDVRVRDTQGGRATLGQ